MKLLVPLLVASLTASTSSAAVLSGRMTVSSYMWDRDEIDSTNTQHLQNNGTLGLRLARIGGQDLELSTTMRGSYDKRNQGDNVNDYRVQDFMARWKHIANIADLTVGRQRIFWPSTSVAVDGASGEIDILNSLEIGGYVGSLAPEDGHFKQTDFDEDHAFGVRVVSQSKAVGRATLSFAERRHAASYNSTPLNTLASRIAAIDWRRSVTGFGSLYGNLMYDLPRQQIGRAQATARWDIKPTVSLQAEYLYRRPSIAYNSIFWVFGQSDYTEGRARAYWRPTPIWSFSAGLASVSVTGDNATRCDIGVSHRYFSLMLHAKSGVAGNTAGISGDLSYPINTRWTVRGGSNYSSYELIQDQAESNTEASVWGGVRWQLSSQSLIDVEAQYLNHDDARALGDVSNNSDFRLLARISFWFLQRVGEAGGKS